MSSDLLRQRRNLMVLSAIFLFMKFAQIEIHKFSIVGIEFNSFKNPNTFFLALWIAWIYFSVRYYQYFVQEGFPYFKEIFYAILDEKSTQKINAIVEKQYPLNTRKNVSYTILKQWNWVYSGQFDSCKNGVYGIDIRNFEMPISKWQLFPEILSSISCIMLNRSAFTDYFLPIIIAIITFCYCCSGWDGGILPSMKLLIS